MSSGIIRYFLELCENAFNVAMRNGFNFTAARPLTVHEQDSAAQAVSARKVDEVDSYTPYGMHLKKFVSVLGSVFESLHEDKKISEPERNHFSTRPEDLSEEARKILKAALFWTILQERPLTKDKAPSSLGAEVEYHLNHIYSPYFQISYRRKRSLYIDPTLMNVMLVGEVQSAKAAGREILARKTVTPTEELETEGQFSSAQGELWVRRFEQE
jgi:hypothetical protein